MSNAEHLIENAIMDFERDGNFDKFLNSKHNTVMAEMVGISLDDVTAMAIHVICAFKPDWIQQGRDEMIEQYDNEPPREGGNITRIEVLL